MQTRTRLLLSALLAALTLSAALSTAQARRFQVSEQHFLAIWGEAEKLQFEALVNIECKVTLEGSFHSRTLSKVSGQLVGYISNAVLARPCVNGEAWIQNGIETLPNGTRPNTLPWHIRYDSFTGTLPRIERIRLQLIGAAFLIRAPSVGTGCLVTTTAASPAFGFVEVEAGGAVTGLRADERPGIGGAVKLEGLLCPTGHFAHRGSVFSWNGTEGLNETRITVRLVQ